MLLKCLLYILILLRRVIIKGSLTTAHRGPSTTISKGKIATPALLEYLRNFLPPFRNGTLLITAPRLAIISSLDYSLVIPSEFPTKTISRWKNSRRNFNTHIPKAPEIESRKYYNFYIRRRSIPLANSPVCNVLLMGIEKRSTFISQFQLLCPNCAVPYEGSEKLLLRNWKKYKRPSSFATLAVSSHLRRTNFGTLSPWLCRKCLLPNR